MNNAEYKKFIEIPSIELYLKKFNCNLVNFWICLTNDKKGMVNKRLNQIAMIIEQILATRNAKFIGPLSFSQGLVKWSLSGSKTAHTIDGVSSASGSIKTLRGVLKHSADNNRNFCFSSGDVDVFADNTQKKGKTSHVKEDGIAPLNVATNVVFIQSNPATNYQSLSYHLYYDVTFNLLLGLKCFRAGIRRSNSLFALAGRQKVAPCLLFIGNHMIYRDIIVNDMQIRVEAPDDINKFIARNELFSVSRDNCKEKGGDYITEIENKHLKSHLPPGVPILKHWVEAARNHEVLKKNRDILFERLNINDPGKEESSIFKFEDEIMMLRETIRKSGILLNPRSGTILKAIACCQLHSDLVNFYITANENFHSYIKIGADPKPVFITCEDENLYNEVSNWNIPKLKKEIFSLTDTFTNTEAAAMYLSIYNTLPKSNKRRHRVLRRSKR